MNTKTTKFLAVLAVLAMAFAAFAIAAPAESDDADSATHTATAITDTITAATASAYYYVDVTNAGAKTTLTIADGLGDVDKLVYTIYVIGGSATNTIELKGTSTTDSGTYAATIKVYAASAVSSGTVTYDPSKYVQFKTEAGSSDIGAIELVTSTTAMYLKSSTIAEPFFLESAYVYAAANQYDIVMPGTTTTLKAANNSAANGLYIPANAIKGTYTVTENVASTGTVNLIADGTDAGYIQAFYDTTNGLSITSEGWAGVITPTAGKVYSTATLAAAEVNAFSTGIKTGATTLYATGYAGTATITYVYGTVSGTITNTTSAKIDLIGVTGTIGVSQKQSDTTTRTITIKATGASGYLANTINYCDQISAGTVDVTAGTFKVQNDSVTAGAIVNVLENAEAVLTDDTTYAQTGTLNLFGKISVQSDVEWEGATTNISVGPKAYGKMPTTGVGNVLYGDYTKIKGEFDYDTTMSNMILDGDLKITNGATVTIIGFVGLNNHSITVENGKLVIASSGFVFAGTTTPAAAVNSVVIGAKGALENNGVLGANLSVAIMAGAGGKVTQNGVTGVTFKYGKTTDDVEVLRISGNAVASSDAWAPAVPTITSDDKTQITGTFTIGAEVTYIPTGTVMNSGATLVSNGSLGTSANDATITMKNKTSATVNGYFDGTLTMEVLDAMKADKTYKTADFAKTTVSGDTAATFTVTGFTVYVAQTSYVNDDGDLFYNQRAYINGTLRTTNTTSTNTHEPLTIGGTVKSDSGKALYVADEDILTVTKTAKLKGEGNTVYVQGLFVGAGGYLDENAPTMNGVYYTTTSDAVSTYYYSDFDTAYALLDTVDNKKITLKGGVKVEADADYVISANQWVAIDGTANGITIPEGITVTVEKDGKIDNAAISFVEGKLVVMNGGACSPAATAYDVTSTNTAGDKTYCGLQAALDDATGEVTITLTNDKTGDNALTSLSVKSGITLNINSNVVIKKTITVADGAKVVVANTGSMIVGSGDDVKNRKAIIDGELDLSAVTTSSFNGLSDDNKLVINVNGMLKFNGNVAFKKCDINGVQCTLSGVSVYTTIDQAVAGGATSVTFVGKYVNPDADFIAPSKITIADGAEVVLGEIDITGKATITANGELTATIKGVDGVLEIPTQITVGEFKGTISETSKTTSAGLTEYTFALSDMTAGSVAVTAGIVHITSDITIAEDKVFAIAEEAAVVSAGDYTITNNGSLLNAGIISVNDNKLIITSDAKALFAVSGDVVVAEDGELEFNTAAITGDFTVYGKMTTKGDVILTGTITVYDDDEITGTLSIEGDVVIGEYDATAAAAAIIGEFTLAGDKYILAFEGALFDTTGLKYTEIYINDELYATAFVKSGNVDMFAKKIINDKIEVDDYVLTGITDFKNWYDEDGDKLSVDTQKNIGVESEIYFYGTLATVDITVSWANGLSLYIDGVRMTVSVLPVTLDVGTHTVSAQVNAGYACDNMKITFNGVVVPVTASGTLIVLDVDDDGSILAVSGDVYIPEPEPVTPEEKSEWTITTILLVVLVILIAIMAVIVH